MPILERVPLSDLKTRFFSNLPKNQPSEEVDSTVSHSGVVAAIEPALVAPVTESQQEPALEIETPRLNDSSPLSLHSILKNIDVGFSREIYELEQFARLQAMADASAGLPRQDAQVLETLAIESQFKDRALSIFGEWEDRVRRRFQDGIEASSKRAGDCLVQFSHLIGKLRQTSNELERTEARLEGYESSLTDSEQTFGYKRGVSQWLFWPSMILLLIIDWVANVPIFTELYNGDADYTQRMRVLSLNASDLGNGAGWYLIKGRVLLSLEASTLALGTVIFLMLLAHFFGKNLRRLVSFSSKGEQEGATPKLRTLRREAKWPCWGTLLGLVLMISFLFATRYMIGPMSQKRFDLKAGEVERQADSAAKAESAANLGDQQAALDARINAQHQLDVLKDRKDLALGISAVNIPMLLLNVVLVISATSLSYFHDEVSVIESRNADPTLLDLEAKLKKLQEDKLNQQTSIQALDRDIQDNLSTAHHLSQARPLKIWDAKAHRLSCTINLYRTENARLRGVDVHNINAFRTDCRIDWPQIAVDQWYSLPPSHAVAEKEYQELRGDYLRLASGAQRL